VLWRLSARKSLGERQDIRRRQRILWLRQQRVARWCTNDRPTHRATKLGDHQRRGPMRSMRFVPHAPDLAWEPDGLDGWPDTGVPEERPCGSVEPSRPVGQSAVGILIRCSRAVLTRPLYVIMLRPGWGDDADPAQAPSAGCVACDFGAGHSAHCGVRAFPQGGLASGFSRADDRVGTGTPIRRNALTGAARGP
jgi:hypothetical protein